MVEVGKYNTLKVVKEVSFGMYLDGDGVEILLPKRYVPEGLRPGDEIEVFIYHDNEQRLVATTARPLGIVGEIVQMEAVDVNSKGAFMKWGIMKDVFVPLSQMVSRMTPGDRYFIYLFIDEKTGRVTGTEKIDRLISNQELAVKEGDAVQLLVYQKTELGFKVIINNRGLGLLHHNEIFRELRIGEKVPGFVKHIRPDGKIDVSLGIKGYNRVPDEEQHILDLLKQNDGYLPFNDKSEPADIYDFFGISKKTFKMVVGSLYKKRLISITQTGIKAEELL